MVCFLPAPVYFPFFFLVVLIFYVIVFLKAQLLLKAAAADFVKILFLHFKNTGEEKRGKKRKISDLLTAEEGKAYRM